MLKFILLVTLAVASYGASIPKEKTLEIEQYIVGGRDTDISEVPYQVAMNIRGEFICGGSIISPTMIVTAAHCVHGQRASEMTFRAGSTNLNSGGVVVKAKTFWYHPGYKPKGMEYDVAVVELAEPLPFSNTIKPIKLATSEPSDGSEVKVSGWGFLTEDGVLATTLQSVFVPMVNRKACISAYSHFLFITPRMICAGVEDKDACQGDSGGPLNHNGQLAGVVSFGLGCGSAEYPGVYVNVANPEITNFIRKYAAKKTPKAQKRENVVL